MDLRSGLKSMQETIFNAELPSGGASGGGGGSAGTYSSHKAHKQFHGN